MANISLKAEKRKELGRKVKRLRRDGKMPANVYGKKAKSQAITVDLSEFEKVFEKAGETSIIELVIGKSKHPTLIHEIQKDPVTDVPIHADFMQVDLKEKVTAQIPVELTGESPAEKQGLGTVVQYIDEVEVEALPTNLPEKFEVDISKLTEVDQQIQIKDLAVDKSKITIRNEEDQILTKVEPPREEEEEVLHEEEKEVEGEELEGEEGTQMEGEELEAGADSEKDSGAKTKE
jgi:large subunit ribosomal protein L25